jgi:NAD(P)H-binding
LILSTGAAQSGLDYTIIHPGGLVDTPGGTEEFVLDVDDNLYQGPNRSTRISREDLADLCIASLSVASGYPSTSNSNNRRQQQQEPRGVSFDCITRPIERDGDDDASTANATTRRTAEEALTEFLDLSKTANYAL